MLYLSHGSAAQYWRAYRSGLVPEPVPLRNCSLEDAETNLHALHELKLDKNLLKNDRFHLAIPDIKMSYASKQCRMHLWNHPLPRESIFQVSNNVRIFSPELIALQFAKTERILSVVEYLMETIGNYTLNEHAERGFVNVKALSSLEFVLKCADEVGGSRGMAKLKQACSSAKAGSMSPRETALFLALTLSTKRGGFELEQPELGHKVDIVGQNRQMTLDEYYLADLCWPQKRVIAEYDGQTDHLAPKDVLRDKSRRSVLAAMGYRVIVFTREDCRSYRDYNMRVEQLKQLLKSKSKRPPSEAALVKRESLRRYLFSPAHFHNSPATRPLFAVQVGADGGSNLREGAQV